MKTAYIFLCLSMLMAVPSGLFGRHAGLKLGGGIIGGLFALDLAKSVLSNNCCEERVVFVNDESEALREERAKNAYLRRELAKQNKNRAKKVVVVDVDEYDDE